MTAFGEAVDIGLVDPRSFDNLWVEAGSAMSGGSANQLELPRQASAFFTGDHPRYDHDHRLIGVLVLTRGGRTWDNRKLTWHGKNRMERINLPTRRQGGFENYAGTAVLFRRRPDGMFVIDAASIGTGEAQTWRQAAQAGGHIYELGAAGRSERECGLF